MTTNQNLIFSIPTPPHSNHVFSVCEQIDVARSILDCVRNLHAKIEGTLALPNMFTDPEVRQSVVETLDYLDNTIIDSHIPHLKTEAEKEFDRIAAFDEADYQRQVAAIYNSK